MQSNYNNTKNNFAKKAIIVLGVFIFTYTIARAYFISITWDESQSYREYISNTIVFPETYVFMSANNHFLNTFGGIIFTTIFGVSEFSLRITSLLFHLLFILFSAKLVLKIEHKWLSVCAFLILNLNPFLLDFFSLARGYSISIACMMVSVYYLYRFLETGYQNKFVFYSLIASIIGTYGNLTLLNFSLVLIGTFYIIFYLNYIHQQNGIFASVLKSIKRMAFPSILFILFLAFIIPISLKLREANALFMGGNNGLWQDTLGTIVPRLLYDFDKNCFLIIASKLLFIITIITSISYVSYCVFKNKTSIQTKFLAALTFIFISIVVSTILQHYLFGTLYLIERAVLFLFVLVNCIFVFLFVTIDRIYKMAQFLLYGFAILVGVHFLYSFNLKYVYEWKDDCETREMLKDLEKLNPQPGEKYNVTLGIPLALESSINYYREINNMNWLNKVERSKTVNYTDDFYFLRPIDYEQAVGDSLEIIKTYPITGNILAKTKNKVSIQTVFENFTLKKVSGEKTFRIHSDTLYGPVFTFNINDTRMLKKTLLSYTFKVQAQKPLQKNVYLVTTHDNAEKTYRWVNEKINDFVPKNSIWGTYTISYYLPAETALRDKLNMYIWNPERQSLVVKDIKIKIIRYN